MKTIAGLICFSMLAVATPPVPVIFDTDIGNDVDDALALAMLHALASRGEARLAAVTVTKDNVWAGRLVSAINLFYGRGDVPVGVVHDGATKDEGYSRKAIEAGRWRYSEKVSDAVELLEKTLRAEADGSVVVIQVGFSTNLAHLLGRPGGRELVKRKVGLLSMMAGDFAGGGPEYNVKEDLESARKLAAEWPTAILWSGFEVGNTIKFPATAIEKEFSWTKRHPVVDAYKTFMKFPYDRETWDLTAVLAALRPEERYFAVSPPGTVTVDARGFTRFAEKAGGRDRILRAPESKRARALEAMVRLASQPAGR